MKSQLLRYGSITLATLGLGLGVAAASSVDIDTTGPDSSNRVNLSERNDIDINNHNDLDVDNRTTQRADSGDATVRRNTNGGDSTSGDASNDSDVSTDISVTNGSCGCFEGLFGGGDHSVSLSNTGPDSHNSVNIRSNNSLDITNRNNVDVDNNTTQTANSGNAKVERNTNGGSATSGDASNTSSVSTSVSIEN